jgi:basic membrane protein A and related proteins
MSRINRSIALLMIAMMLVLAACSGSGGAGGKKIRAALIVTALGDRSFADSAWDGIKRVDAELKEKVQTKVIEAPEIASYEENITQFAKDGYDLIIVLGFTYVDLLNKLAPTYPNTKFLIVDATVDQPNIRSVVFKEHEGSFLAGALAAMKSTTGKVGFIGGQDIPLIHRFQGGFEQGAKHVNPSIDVQVAYVGSWTDAAKGKELTMVMFNRGADVVYAAAGGSGAGTIEAAKEAKKWSVGVDSNQDHLAPENMIGSMMKRVDNAVFATIKDLADGKFTGGTVVMGMSEEGIGLSGLAPIYSEISIKNGGKENLEKVAKLRQEIIDGKITVVDKMQTK